MVVAVGGGDKMMESIPPPPPLLVVPPQPSLSSVSTFSVPHPPTFLDIPGEGSLGLGDSGNQFSNPSSYIHHASSFSSSCGSSSSTTGSVSGGGGGGGAFGSGGIGDIGSRGDTSSRISSAGSSSMSGSNPRLNHPHVCNKLPIQTIPLPLSSSATTMSLYQVHDGFATVRKRKGRSAAAIAMRQQEEIYDLAQPFSPVPTEPPKIPSFQGKSITCNVVTTGGNGPRNSMFAKSHAQPYSLDSATKTSPEKCDGSAKSASLLSKHPSLNLRNGRDTLHNTTGQPYQICGQIGRNSSPTMNLSCNNPSCSKLPQPVTSACACPCPCTCKCKDPTESSANNRRSMRLGKSGSTVSNTLGRKLIKLVLPSNKSGNDKNSPVIESASMQSTPPSLATAHQFHSTTYETDPISMETSSYVPILKSTSMTFGGGARPVPPPVAPPQPQFHFSTQQPIYQSVLQETGVGARTGRLRNSISDNSIAAALHNRENGIMSCSSPVSNGIEVDVESYPSAPSSLGNSIAGSISPVDRSGSSVGSCGNGGSCTCTSNGNTIRNFHRSCFLPKAPPLEPVMEDGIPWRQTRKDVPWWEVAIRRGRYRSCPLLQASPQVTCETRQQSLNLHSAKHKSQEVVRSTLAK